METTYKKLLRSNWLYPMLFLLGFLVILTMHLYKVPLEIQGSDEVYYLTIPKRILDGDALLVDEWHGSQLSALLLLPFVWLHKLIFGYEKILLHFRYIYVTVHALCTLIVYLRLRSYKLFGALASLFFFLFTPSGIMALSYNSMGYMLMTLTGVLLATAKSKKVYCISGLLFAGAVLCCPYLILVYVLSSLAVWLYSWKTKKMVPLQAWGLFIIGAVILAVPVMAFIFSRASLGEILNTLPYIFSDPGHSGRPLWRFIAQYAKAFFGTHPARTFPFVLFYFVTVIFALKDRRQIRERRLWYFFISIAVALILLVDNISGWPEVRYNLFMLPLFYIGLMSYIITEKRNQRVAIFIFGGGLLYTFCIHLSSNTTATVITQALTVADMGSILLFEDALKEIGSDLRRSNSHWKLRALRSAALVLFVVQFSLMGYLDINFKASSTTENRLLTETLSTGPYEGIRVTPETKETYMKNVRLLQPLTEKQGTVFYVGSNPWMYFVTPKLRMGAYTSWTGKEDVDFEYLASYYAVNPDRLPDYIYLRPDISISYDVFQSMIIDQYGYHQETIPAGENSGAILYCR